MVFRRMDDPVLLMQIDHGRLNIGMAQHGLDLPDRGPMVQGECRRRMAQRMGRDRPNGLRLSVEQPSQARLLEMRSHHRLDRPHAQGPAAATLRDIQFFRVVLPRPRQPTEERMFGEQTTEGVDGSTT